MAPFRDGRIGDLPEALASGLGYSVALLIPALLTRGAIGMGDVKLAILLGLFTGYHGWETTVAALAGGFLLAGAVGVLLLALRRITRHDHLPFGPFMIAGAWFAIARALVGFSSPGSCRLPLTTDRSPLIAWLLTRAYGLLTAVSCRVRMSLLSDLTRIVAAGFESAGLDASFGAVQVSDRPDLGQFQCNGALAAAQKRPLVTRVP